MSIFKVQSIQDEIFVSFNQFQVIRSVFFCVHCHFVVLPPGHGRSVTDFCGWDAHEAQLRCPDDVSGDTGRCSARKAPKPKFY